MIRILIVASMLGKDGTSRFITHFANGMSKYEDFKISILFFRPVDSVFLSKLDNNVDVKCLNISGKLWLSVVPILTTILRKKPNFCILGFHQLLFMGLLAPLFHIFGVRIMIRDTIIPSLFHQNINKLYHKLSICAYQSFDNIIVQSNDMQNDLVNNWGVNIKKTILINNPVDTVQINSRIYDCPDELKNKNIFTFVSAGRLTYQKGYDIIIERMHEMQPNIPFKLLILGSGELEHELKERIANYQLEDNISFLGYHDNVASYLFYSDALLLSSRYEGFPNIVLEAQALGKPVFSNSCLGGINEILINGENGWVCQFEDRIEFVDGLKKFFQSSFSPDYIRNLTSSRYDKSTIIEKYASVFRTL